MPPRCAGALRVWRTVRFAARSRDRACPRASWPRSCTTLPWHAAPRRAAGQPTAPPENAWRRGPERERHVFARRDERRAVLLEHVQVGAGAEGAPGARDDDDPHDVALREQAEGLAQVVAQGAIQGVELLRPVEGHRTDAPGDLHQHALVRRHYARSTIMAIPWPTPIHMVHKP